MTPEEYMAKATRLICAGVGKFINQVERIRLIADYTGEGVAAEKAQEAIEKAGEFLGVMERYVESVRSVKDSSKSK